MPQLHHRQNDRIQNRYEVRKLLGSGAFGTVYGCRDLELDVPVAVKELHVLDESGGEREHALKQFRAEATHLSKLRHPHIVSGHYEPFSGDWRVCPVCGLDFPAQNRCPDHNAPLVAVSSRHYLVMEYIAGPDLLQLATQNGGRIEAEAALDYGADVASALAHIHARGFVHRDIKPENIRLRAEADEAVLLDFGIATSGPAASGDRYGTQVQRHTQGGGTIGYAPESPSERRSPDARSDVHAWGMTMYHLLTARDPTEPNDLRAMRSHTPRDFDPHLPAALDKLVMECIALEPANRPQNGAELVQRIENLTAAPVAASAPVSTAVLTQSEIEPFVFRSGHYARNVAELAPLLDEFRDEAALRLSRGEIEHWLASTGETELARRAAEIRGRYPARPKQALEAFAQALGLPRPILEVSSPTLRFGSLSPDAQKTLDLRVENRGRGHLFGLVRASHPAVSTYGEWDGNRARLPVTFDANRLRPGHYAGELSLDSSAGQFSVPFEADVRGPSWLAPFWTVLLYGAAGMVAGGLIRALPALYAPQQVSLGWLNQIPKWWPVAPLFGGVFGLVLFALVTLESLSRRSCALWLSMGFFGTLAVLGAGIFGNELLTAGDAALRPIFSPNVGPFAPGAWMFAGTLAGALWGSLRRFKDALSIRIGAIALGWGAALLLLYAALSGVASAR